MHNKFITLILQNLVLFPNQEVKLELNNDLSKSIINKSNTNNRNELVMISPKDELETSPDLKDLPLIGINCKIKQKLDLPNGNMRVTLRGVKRVAIDKYNFNEELIECSVKSIENPNYNLDEELAYSRKLKVLMEKYVSTDSTATNAILGIIKNVTNLSKLSDMIAASVNFDYKQKIKLFEETNYYKRARMLITILNNSIRAIELENKIDEEVRSNFEKSEKDIIVKEKIKLLSEELGNSGDKYTEADSFLKKIDSLKIEANIKKNLTEEVKKFEMTLETSPELSVIRGHLDYLVNLPWNKSTKDKTNIEEIDNYLNKLHYGLDKAKTRVEEYLLLKRKNKNLTSPILCLIGPPGTGKTTFARELANSIGREFIKISVGGLNDSSELIGHRRTYIGAGPGKIIESIKKSGVNNPVILIDEVDKMVKDYKGDPASVLLDILDPKQNKEFVDNYIAEPFDLSSVIFILTANDEANIPDALYDRLEIIEVNSYTIFDKLEIAKKYTMPRLAKEYGFKDGSIKFSDAVIKKIITDYTLEAGVRDLERKLSSIVRKVLIQKIDDKQTVINESDLLKYLGNNSYSSYTNSYDRVGTVNVPAYTPLGGSVLNIETVLYPGKEDVIITGSLGDVMLESVEVALSYIKANADTLQIDINKLINNTLHIHALDGSSKKEGPSAGLAITVSIMSLLLNKKIPNTTAFTGEITLGGRILKVGGIKEKVISSYNKGIKKLYIPMENIGDINLIPKKIIKSINIIPVNMFDEVYQDIF